MYVRMGTPMTLQRPQRSYSPRRVRVMVRVIQSIMLHLVPIQQQQGGCSSSPDRPLSFAVWGPAGPLVLKVDPCSGACPQEGRGTIMQLHNCTTGAIQHGRAFGYRSGSLDPERGPLKPIRGPLCTTGGPAAWKGPLIPEVVPRASEYSELDGPASGNTNPFHAAWPLLCTMRLLLGCRAPTRS